MPMIVLEGPDGSGKSTLFEKLKPVFREYEFLHSGGPIRSSLDLDARMRQSHPRQVRDRHFCLSEPIYGPLFGRQNLITEPVTQHFMRQSPFVIFCFALDDAMPPQTGEYDTPDHVAGLVANREAILDAYRQLATRGDLPYPRVIYRWVNYDFVVEQALKHERNRM